MRIILCANTLVILVCLVSVFLVASCGKHEKSPSDQLPLTEITTPVFATPGLPTPAELDGLQLQRETSYTDVDLVLLGRDCDFGLDNQLVAQQGNLGVFSPDWSGGLNGLSYGIYPFAISGFDREPVVIYGFNEPPADYSNVWYGLANFDTDRWDWHQASTTGGLSFPTIDPHMSSVDIVYIAWVVTGNEPVELAFTRIGPQQIHAGYAATPFAGIAPLSVSLSAAGSTTDYGTITKFEWDLDGDGVFDVDTGTTTSYEFSITESGTFNPAVRVTNSLDEFEVDVDSVDVYEPWGHTWGSTDEDSFEEVALYGTSSIYAAGYHTVSGIEDVLVAKFDLDGTPLWIRAWGEEDQIDEVSGMAVTDGGIYLTGSSSSYFADGQDILIQRWDHTGNVTWSRTFNHEDYASEYGTAIQVNSEAVYVTGVLDDSTGDAADGILLSLDLNGGLNWVRSFGGDGAEAAVDAKLFTPLLGSTEIHVLGSSKSNSYGAGDESILYAVYEPDGTMTQLESWGHMNNSATPGRLLPTGWFTPGYIAGSYTTTAGQTFALVLRLNPSGDPVAMGLSMGTSIFDDCADVTVIGDKTYAACFNYSGDAYMVVLDFLDTVNASYLWAASEGSSDGRFYDICQFPGSGGVLLTGKCPRHQGFQLNSTAVNLTSIATASWVTLPLEQDEVAGEVTMPTADSRDVVGDGTWDTGGGSWDALILATNLTD